MRLLKKASVYRIDMRIKQWVEEQTSEGVGHPEKTVVRGNDCVGGHEMSVSVQCSHFCPGYLADTETGNR